MNVSISYGFGEDNRYRLEVIPVNIQLAIYKYELYEKYKEFILATLKKRSTLVNAVHLPLDTFRINPIKIFDMMSAIHEETKCIKYVIHPNKGIEMFLRHFKIMNYKDISLCVETFNWRRKKILRTPLDIIDYIRDNFRGKVQMTLDTSHIEDVWFDHKIMRYLLKYTSVIHLSNRSDEFGEHLPFNDPRGSLNLVKFVRDLKNVYHWNGDIVLEYMPEYHHKLIKNSKYVQRLIE